MARIYSCLLVGVDVVLIEIEATLGQGFSGLNLLGLPSDVTRDMRERVRSALEAVGFVIPARRVVVSVSPRETLKLSRSSLGQLDFAVAVAIMRVLWEEKHTSLPDVGQELCVGELTLGGEIRTQLPSLFLKAASAKLSSRQTICVGASNDEKDETLYETYSHLSQWFFARKSGTPTHKFGTAALKKETIFDTESFQATFSETIQILARHPQLCVALLAAAAGGHHILVAGEPGIGKSFSFRKYQNLLLPLPPTKAVEVQLIHGNEGLTTQPFRAPHHSCTSAALVGGASLKPGEVTLAHHGVLFLDELAEFPRTTLEALREPLDTENVTLSRAAGAVSYPAHFQLCATTNPCPCGYHFSRKQPCRCYPTESKRYLQKMSGPLLDRFPLQIWLDPPDHENFSHKPKEDDPFVKALLQDLDHEERLTDLATRFIALQSQRLGYEDPLPTRVKKGGLIPKKAGEFSEGSPFSLSFRGEDHMEAVGKTLEALFPSTLQNKSSQNNASLFHYRRLSKMFQEMS